MELDRAMVPGGWMSVMWKTAFMAGSSKHGNTFLASVACIWLVARTLRRADAPENHLQNPGNNKNGSSDR